MAYSFSDLPQSSQRMLKTAERSFTRWARRHDDGRNGERDRILLTACFKRSRTGRGVAAGAAGTAWRAGRRVPGSSAHLREYFRRHVVRVERCGDAAVDCNLQQHLADLVLRAAVGERAAQVDAQLVRP